jgi:hypothetical protein
VSDDDHSTAHDFDNILRFFAHPLAHLAEVGGHIKHVSPAVSGFGTGLGLGLGPLGFALKVASGEDPASAGMCTMQEMIPLIGLVPLLSGCGLPDSTPPEPRHDDMSYMCPEGEIPTNIGCLDPNTQTFAPPEERLRAQQEEALRQQQEYEQQCSQ